MTRLAILLRSVILILTLVCASQTMARSQQFKITINVKEQKLLDVFKAIQKQTNLIVFYSNSILNDQEKVTIQVKDVSLERVMDQIIAGKSLRYEIQEKYIVISPKESVRNETVQTNISSSPFLEMPNQDVKGVIRDESGKPVPGVSIAVKGMGKGTVTNDNGEFVLIGIDPNSALVISGVNIETIEVKLNGRKEISLIAKPKVNQLQEVEIISLNSGYQTVPKDRATGSFEYIDNKLLNRAVSTDIQGRLEGIASSIAFNKRPLNGEPAFSIRGRSTLFANTNPLIVLDNFPYDGDLSSINPNDVENVTILRDAAAASIWGVRSGNGVIVITTKSGKLNQKTKISFTSNYTFQSAPDLYSVPQLSSEEFIGVETNLYKQGFYNSALNSNYLIVSPVVQLLRNRANGIISAADSALQMNSLKNTDARSAYNDYFTRVSFKQQHQISMTGGGQNNKYYASFGYDENKLNSINDRYKRFTVFGKNTYQFLQNKAEIYTSIQYINTVSESNIDKYSIKYPYESVIDASGNPLTTIRGYKLSYIDSAGKGNLLDWRYMPLNERVVNNTNNRNDLQVSTGLNYRIDNHLNFSLLYQFTKSISDGEVYYQANSYNARDLINTYSVVNYVNNTVNRPIPLGGIKRLTTAQFSNRIGRAQLSYSNKIKGKHDISVLAGFEVKDYRQSTNAASLYGYDSRTGSNVGIDQVGTSYVNFVTRSVGRLPVSIPAESYAVDRFVSYYANGGYTYNEKYGVSFSARRDESNLFGVSTNQKGVPLWSIGATWDLSKERFYHFDLVPYLRVRLTYGINGNLSKSLSAYTTAAVYSGVTQFSQSILEIRNPPNPSLSWEQVKTSNLAIEWKSKNNRLSGSIEAYIKKGMNLIGNAPIAPQVGISTFTGNVASVQTKGIDINLNADILRGPIQWTANLSLSLLRDKVIDYKVVQANNSLYITGNYTNPMVGKPYTALFSYRWGGLDSVGNPIAILDGKPTYTYSSVSGSRNLNELVYHGSQMPTTFGYLRNTFRYHELEFSANIAMRFGYYFRKSSLNNTNLNNGTYMQADYNNRWQKPGDEKITDVPAVIYPVSISRSNFYQYSEVLVGRADNIRIQDIQLAYNFSKNRMLSNVFSSFRVYAYMSNFRPIWVKNKWGIDPELVSSTGSGYSPRTPLAVSFGIQATLK
jgi:TonB-linked SusC/RagA family outer membrane protein